MRHLMRTLRPQPSRLQRGLTLVELMVTIAIGALLLKAAGPYFSDYIANSRLRENGNLLLTEALMAQSEAVKRNARVRLSISSSTVQVIDPVPATPVVLRTRTFTGGVVASAAATVDFTGDGRITTWPNSTTMNLSGAGITCSDDLRCPALLIEPGGAIKLCGNQSSCS